MKKFLTLGFGRSGTIRPDELRRQAFASHRKGDYLGAVAKFRQMFAADPTCQERSASEYVASFSTSRALNAWTAPAEMFPDAHDIAAVFQIIYDRRVWGVGSGGGSDLRNTCLYVAYVQHLMERFEVRTILDLGCGDWSFSRYLDFGGRRYLGVDAVESVVARNVAAFGSPDIRFAQGNLCSSEELPECDLLLCKDVLQHLSTANIVTILAKVGRARVALITNDYHPSNRDCSNGDTRPLNITAPPLNFPGRPVLAFGGKVSFLAGRAPRHPTAMNQIPS